LSIVLNEIKVFFSFSVIGGIAYSYIAFVDKQSNVKAATANEKIPV